MTQEEINNTNWTQSVAGVCISDGKGFTLTPYQTTRSGNFLFTGME